MHPREPRLPPEGASALDVDRLIATHGAAWDRLEALTRRTRRNDLAPAELDELVRLYLRTSSHLSTVRTTMRDPGLVARLSTIVGRANAVVYGSRPRTWRSLGRFVTETFPAAVWHTRRPILASFAAFAIVAVVVGVWLASSDAAVAASAPEEVRAAYLERDFEAYYSSRPAGEFAATVFANNARVGVLAFAVGIAFGLPTLVVLAVNGANLGLAAGLFHAAGQGPRFWGLVLPHGLLELTAVFIAGGAGIRLGWSIVAPGDRTRAAAIAEEGRRAVVIVMGLVGVFLVAGLIEGFVTPSPLPTWARVGVGVIVEAAFVAAIVLLGRRAETQGITGALRRA